MVASVSRLPEQPVALARLMIARPDDHDDCDLIAACEVLATFGDAIDVQRADLLKASIIMRAVAEMNREAKERAFWADLLAAECAAQVAEDQRLQDEARLVAGLTAFVVLFSLILITL